MTRCKPNARIGSEHSTDAERFLVLDLVGESVGAETAFMDDIKRLQSSPWSSKQGYAGVNKGACDNGIVFAGVLSGKTIFTFNDFPPEAVADAEFRIGLGSSRVGPGVL